MIKMYTIFFNNCNKIPILPKLIIVASQLFCCTASFAYDEATNPNYFICYN